MRENALELSILRKGRGDTRYERGEEEETRRREGERGGGEGGREGGRNHRK